MSRKKAKGQQVAEAASAQHTAMHANGQAPAPVTNQTVFSHSSSVTSRSAASSSSTVPGSSSHTSRAQTLAQLELYAAQITRDHGGQVTGQQLSNSLQRVGFFINLQQFGSSSLCDLIAQELAHAFLIETTSVGLVPVQIIRIRAEAQHHEPTASSMPTFSLNTDDSVFPTLAEARSAPTRTRTALPVQHAAPAATNITSATTTGGAKATIVAGQAARSTGSAAAGSTSQAPKHSPAASSPAAGRQTAAAAPHTNAQTHTSPSGATLPHISEAQLKLLLQEARSQLHKQGQHVGLDVLIQHVCQQLGVDSLRALGFDPHKMEYLRNLGQRETRIITNMAAYFYTHSIATLHDLEKYLVRKEAEESPKIKCWDDLKLGPLHRWYYVQLEFKLPPNFSKIPQVEVSDVLDAIWDIMCRRDRTTAAKITGDAICAKLAQSKGVSTGAELGVRVLDGKIGIYIVTLSNLRKREKQAADEFKLMKERILEEQQEACEAELAAGRQLISTYQETMRQQVEHLVHQFMESVQAAKVPEDGYGAWSAEDGSWQEMTDKLRAVVQELDMYMRAHGTMLMEVDPSTVGGAEAAGPEQPSQPDFACASLQQLVSNYIPAGRKGKGKGKGKGAQEGDDAFVEVPLYAATLMRVRNALVLLWRLMQALVQNALPGRVSSSLLDQLMPQDCQQPPHALPLMPSVSVSHQQLKDALTQLHMGLSWPALAALESALADHFSVSCFEQLGRGSSLLALLAAEPELSDVLGGGGAAIVGAGSGSFCPPADEVLGCVDVVMKAHLGRLGGQTSDPDLLHAVQTAVCQQYNIPRVECLGLGPLPQLIAMWQDSQQEAAGSCAILPMHALTVGADLSLASSLPDDPGVLRARARAALSSAPHLAELHSWTLWDTCFAAGLGGLEDFVKSEKDLPFIVLQDSDRRLVVMPRDANEEVFAAAVREQQPAAAAAQLAGMVAGAGGVVCAPLSLLGELVKDCITAALAECGARPQQLHEGSEVPHRLQPLLRFIINAIRCTPGRALRAATADTVFLSPLTSVLGARFCHRALLQCCASADAVLAAEHAQHGQHGAAVCLPSRSMLHELGFALGVIEWQRDWAAVNEQRQQNLQEVERSSCTADQDVGPAGLGTADQESDGGPATAALSNSPAPAVASIMELLSQAAASAAVADQAIAADAGRSARAVDVADAATELPDNAHATATSQRVTTSADDHQESASDATVTVAAADIQPTADVAADELPGDAAGIDHAALPADPVDIADADPVAALPQNRITPTDAADAQHISTLAASAVASTVALSDVDTALYNNQPSCATPAEQQAVDIAGSLADQPLADTATGETDCVTDSDPAGGADPHTTAASSAKADSGDADKRAFILRIRQDEYGVGAQVSESEAARIVRQNERLGRALHRLSRDLYSKDLHFVLELVQNAEDNSYPAGLVPSLEFVLLPDSLLVLNNECGFSPDDLRRLADVGNSKKVGKLGFIGQKGIGFKSVFRVTDAPEIHSNGFHVNFDLRAYGDLGYVLPTWIDALDELRIPSQLRLQSAATKIRLPLKGAAQEVPTANSLADTSAVAGLFEDVDQRLLLFLSKLQCIAITEAPAALKAATPGAPPPLPRSMILAKLAQPHGVVELRYGSHAQHASRWLVVKDRFKPTTSRGDMSPEDIVQTEVCLAFDLDAAASPSGTPEPQPVFAFLPLRCYGLRFVVNADFIVPSSREAVDSNNPWNQMLRRRLPQLFVRALEELQKLPPPASTSGAGGGSTTADHLSDDPSIAWFNYWLRCLPLPGQAQEFFASLPSAIAAEVKARALVPGRGCVRLSPLRHKLRVCSDANMMELIQEQQLQEALEGLGIHFVPGAIQPLHQSPALRELLGVTEFHAQDLVAVLKNLASQPGGAAALGVPLLGRILLALAKACLEAAAARRMPGAGSAGSSGAGPRTSHSHPKHTARGAWAASAPQSSQLSLSADYTRAVQELRQLRLMPLATGGFVSPASLDGPLFLPLTAALPGGQAVSDSQTSEQGPQSSKKTGSKSSKAASTASGREVPISSTSERLLRALANAGMPRGDLCLSFVSSELLQCAQTAEDVALMMRVLQDLGVRQVEADDVMRLHVLPLLRDAATDSLSQQQLMACLAFPLVAGLLQPPVVGHAAGGYGGQGAAGGGGGYGQRGDYQGHRRSVQPAWEPHGNRPPHPPTSHASDTPLPAAQQQLLQELIAHGVVLTNKGPVALQAGTPLYLPVALGGIVDLPAALPAYALHWTLVSEKYLQVKAVGAEAWSWLFHALGAAPFLTPQPRTLYVQPAQPQGHGGPGSPAVPADATPVANSATAGASDVSLLRVGSTQAAADSQLPLSVAGTPQGGNTEGGSQAQVVPQEASPWAGENLGRCPEGHVMRVQDWHCPEFVPLVDAIMQSDASLKARMEQLALVVRLVQQLWHGVFEPALQASAMAMPLLSAVQPGTQPPRVAASRSYSVPSSLLIMLRTASWMPSSRGCTARPSELFLEARELRYRCGGLLPYLAADAAGPWLAQLGLQTTWSWDTALRELKGWSQQAGGLHTSLSQMGRLYSYLQEQAEVGGDAALTAVCQAFHEHALVWLPDREHISAAPADEVHGCFYKAAQLRIFDNTRVFESLPPSDSGTIRILAKYYKQQVPFFQSLARVAEGQMTALRLLPDYPTMAEYVEAARAISRCAGEQVTAEAFNQVTAIFTMWAEGIHRNVLQPLELASLKSSLAYARVFPTLAGSWACVNDGLIIDDDCELSQHFKDVEGVHILRVPPPADAAALDPNRRNYPSRTIEPLLKLLGVPLLSAHVQRQLDYGMVQFGTRLDQIVRLSLRTAQRFLYHRLPDLYASIKEDAASRLKKFQCMVVQQNSLNVRFSLSLPNGQPAVSVPLPRDSVLDGTTLYVCDIREYSSMAGELSRLFSSEGTQQELSQHLHMIMLMYARDSDASEDVETYLRHRGLTELPEGEATWEIPIKEATNAFDALLHTEGHDSDPDDKPTKRKERKAPRPHDPTDPPRERTINPFTIMVGGARVPTGSAPPGGSSGEPGVLQRVLGSAPGTESPMPLGQGHGDGSAPGAADLPRRPAHADSNTRVASEPLVAGDAMASHTASHAHLPGSGTGSAAAGSSNMQGHALAHSMLPANTAVRPADSSSRLPHETIHHSDTQQPLSASAATALWPGTHDLATDALRFGAFELQASGMAPSNSAGCLPADAWPKLTTMIADAPLPTSNDAAHNALVFGSVNVGNSADIAHEPTMDGVSAEHNMPSVLDRSTYPQMADTGFSAADESLNSIHLLEPKSQQPAMLLPPADTSSIRPSPGSQLYLDLMPAKPYLRSPGPVPQAPQEHALPRQGRAVRALGPQLDTHALWPPAAGSAHAVPDMSRDGSLAWSTDHEHETQHLEAPQHMGGRGAGMQQFNPGGDHTGRLYESAQGGRAGSWDGADHAERPRRSPSDVLLSPGPRGYFHAHVDAQDMAALLPQVPVTDPSLLQAAGAAITGAPCAPSLLTLQDRLQIATWGEALVYGYLIRHPQVQEGGWKVEWVNQDGETGLPFDIRLVRTVQGPDGSTGTEALFFEVKTTKAHDKHAFEVSQEEMAFAEEQGARFSIYRVYGAGTEAVRMVVLNNPLQLWRQKLLGVCMMLDRASAGGSYVAPALASAHTDTDEVVA